MEELLLRYIEVGSFLIAALGAVYFGWRQTQINKRLKELEDYAAISIVPSGTQLLIMNVGKINLYLKKYDIGLNTENFRDPLLIPAGTGQYSNIKISLTNFFPAMELTLYLVDELGEKYLTRGKVFTTAIPVQPTSDGASTQTPATVPSNLPAQPMRIAEMNVWVFKTVKFPWNI